MPSGQHGGIEAFEFPVYRKVRPAVRGDRAEVFRIDGVHVETDIVQPATVPERQGGGDGEVEPRPEAQFADTQRRAVRSRPACHRGQVRRFYEYTLRLPRPVRRVVDVAEIPGEGHPVPPGKVGAFDHGATGRSGSAIHSLQDPG